MNYCHISYSCFVHNIYQSICIFTDMGHCSLRSRNNGRAAGTSTGVPDLNPIDNVVEETIMVDAKGNVVGK